MSKTRIGVIGCGMISDTYFNAAKRFGNIEVAACADIDMEVAKKKAEAHENLFPAKTVDELLADPSIELVINLTVPKAHAEVDMQILRAGKHAYSEKPLGVDLDQAREVMKLAAAKNLRIGCAPDTFLGGGQQTARKLIDDGWIGKPIAGTAMVLGRGPEKWAHAPFFFDYGAGPMLDLGPYYITALINLLGPAKSVTAMTTKGSDTRVGGPDTVPHVYPINVTTHLTGVIEFQCGALITVITSFEVYKHGHAPIEIYGSEGTLQVPDPNTFGGPVKLFRNGYSDWVECPLSHGYTANSRSIGAADIINALKSGRPHRASGELAFHALEIMLAFDKSSKLGAKVMLESTCKQPAPLPLGLEDGELDD